MLVLRRLLVLAADLARALLGRSDAVAPTEGFLGLLRVGVLLRLAHLSNLVTKFCVAPLGNFLELHLATFRRSLEISDR